MPKSVELDHRPCFVVSTGRCGSQMIARVLDLHPEIGAFHEPRPLLNTTGYLRWSGHRGADYVQSRLGRKRDRLLRDLDADGLMYLESSHFLSHLVPELRKRYDARFVHLYRDGRDFARSGLERGWYEAGGVLHRVVTWIRRATGLQVGDSYTDHRLDPPRSLDGRLERVAWLWAEVNGVILAQLRRLPSEDVISVRLEDFGAEMIRRLLAFLGRDAPAWLVAEMEALAAIRPNRTEDRRVPPPEKWSEEQVQRFWRVAGEMMERLGYSDA